MWKFLGQGSNWSHSCNPCFSCSNARSLTLCTTVRTPIWILKVDRKKAYFRQGKFPCFPFLPSSLPPSFLIQNCKLFFSLPSSVCVCVCVCVCLRTRSVKAVDVKSENLADSYHVLCLHGFSFWSRKGGGPWPHPKPLWGSCSCQGLPPLSV